MTLPLIVTPEYRTTIPSTKQEISYRPFLVKQEKVLLTAQESDDDKDQILAVAKVLSECITTPDIIIGDLTSFDIEYLFLKLRAKSVGETITIKVGHQGTSNPSGTLENKCDYKTEVIINIDDIKAPTITVDKKIQLTDDIGVVLKYPTFHDMANNETDSKVSVNFIFETLTKSIDYVYDKENVYNDFTESEVKDWVDSLSQAQFEKISKFFVDIPVLQHEVSWKCSKCNKEETIMISGLSNFFT
tara:strand:- start:377 stop:1111 length:735 start_codon:yes stop_codon:yes gene_type:complete